MDYTFDLDGTLCTQPHLTEFDKALPFKARIALVNALYQEGHRILIDTARGSRSGRDCEALTISQLRDWGVMYSELRVGQKRGAEVYVDDRAISADLFFGDGPSLLERRARSENIPDFAHEYFDHLHLAARSIPKSAIACLVSELEASRALGRSVFLVANGGSAASAQHMANGLGPYLQRKAGHSFRLRALTENIAALTGQANDSGFSQVFVDQLAATYQEGDVLIAISCSGNSPNILEAARWVKDKGGRVIGMVGFDGGELKQICDITIHVQTGEGEYGPVEDAHMALAHVLVHWYQGNTE